MILSKDKSWERCVICGKLVADGHKHVDDLYELKKNRVNYDKLMKSFGEKK